MAETKHFGQYFKQRREERGMSLKEVENVTSIRATYLDAIEQGNFHQVISPVYAKGFVKQYANYLGLDGDRFIQEFAHLFGETSAKVDETLGLGTLEPRNTHSPSRLLPTLASLLMTALILIAAWLLASYFELV